MRDRVQYLYSQPYRGTDGHADYIANPSADAKDTCADVRALVETIGGTHHGRSHCPTIGGAHICAYFGTDDGHSNGCADDTPHHGLTDGLSVVLALQYPNGDAQRTPIGIANLSAHVNSHGRSYLWTDHYQDTDGPPHHFSHAHRQYAPVEHTDRSA